jgi:Tfp pilus assembly protein PilN
MSQQINLMHAGLTPRAEPFRSGQALIALGGAVLLIALMVFGLQQLAVQRDTQAAAAEEALATLQARVASLSAAAPASRQATELRQLRDAEAGQRQVRAALDSGVAGRTQGYAQYFLALSRQAQPSLWITGFSVAADGTALELQGRMTDPRRLPDYLRHLNSEPLFKGREFAQMSVKSLDAPAVDNTVAAAPTGVTEFALRATPVAAANAP